jgi:hypothetical protein
MRTTWTFHTAGQLIFRRGATAQLGDAAVRQRVRRMLVVTDATLLRAGSSLSGLPAGVASRRGHDLPGSQAALVCLCRVPRPRWDRTHLA